MNDQHPTHDRPERSGQPGSRPDPAGGQVSPQGAAPVPPGAPEVAPQSAATGTPRAEPSEKPAAEKPAEGKAEGEPEEQAVPPGRRRKILIIALVALAVAAIGGGAYYLHARHFESTDDAFIEGRVTPISPKVSGHVTKLLVDDNWDVKEGQLLLEIDPRDYEARLEQAKAQLEAARSRLASAEAGVVRARADLEAAEAEVASAQTESERAAQDLQRYEAAGNAVTRQSLDNARALATSTAAQLRAAREKAAAAKSQVPYAASQVAVVKAEIEQANALGREAELQLSYTKIYAPVAGRVTRRSVEVGTYVQPGEALLALVEKDVWVIANFRETQLRDMHVGQPVEIEVDAFPEHELKGKVESIMRGTGARFSLIPPENATGNYVKVVQRVPVKITFDDPLPEGHELGVGLSVVPTVRVR